MALKTNHPKRQHCVPKRRWMLQSDPDSTPFYISDNPVVMVNYVEPRALTIDHPSVEIYLPISRQFSLHFVSEVLATSLLAGLAPEAHHQEEGTYKGNADLLGPKHVEHQNSLQVQQASRFIISSSVDFTVAKETLRNPSLKGPPGFDVS